VTGELLHESIAETADLVVGSPLRIKVATTLGTSHVNSSEGVLKDLLESEELEDRKVNGRMEAESSLVRAKGRVELDTITTLDMWLSVIIFPDNAELDDTLWDLKDGSGHYHWQQMNEYAPGRSQMRVRIRDVSRGTEQSTLPTRSLPGGEKLLISSIWI
jgi:hypothetical protein